MWLHFHGHSRCKSFEIVANHLKPFWELPILYEQLIRGQGQIQNTDPGSGSKTFQRCGWMPTNQWQTFWIQGAFSLLPGPSRLGMKIRMVHSPCKILSGWWSEQQLGCCAWNSAPRGGSFPLLPFLWRRVVMLKHCNQTGEECAWVRITHTYG